MNPLFNSQHFALISMEKGGENKKDIYGNLRFKGLPSEYGGHREVLAVEDGVVIESEYDRNIYTRKHRLGSHVTVIGRSGETITYALLDERRVKNGDTVAAGQVIGMQQPNVPIMLEFRKNGRRIDGCRYLGIEPKPQTFRPPARSDVEAVCFMLNIDTQMRTYIDAHPRANEFWFKLRKKLEHLKEE